MSFLQAFSVMLILFMILGNSALSQCLQCTNGSYCQGTGNVKPTGLCDPGFYCPSGQHSKQAIACPQGYYCPAGSPAPVLCPSGKWQDEVQKAECKVCPEGYFCDRANGPITSYSGYACPNGFYCPNGTRYSTEYGCPNGTYGNGTKLVRASQCLPCQPGRYCHGMYTMITLVAMLFYCL